MQPEQRLHDQDRDAALQQLGLQICRVTNKDVRTDIGTVLARIREAARWNGRAVVNADADATGA